MPTDEEKLTAIRIKIAERKAERDRVASAPLAAKTLIAQKHAQVDRALEMLCSPEHDLSRSYSPVDCALLFTATFADQLKKNIAEHIEKISPKNALTPEQKEARLDELAKEVLKLEREEEGFCVELEEKGVSIVRRSDLDPAVFLEG